MKTRYRILALCKDKNGNVISRGINSYSKSHPLQAYFAKKVGRPEQIYLHAEIQAILRAKEQQIDTIEIYRVNFNFTQQNARPCPICMEAIKAFGIKHIFYTTDTGMKEYGKEMEI